MKPITVQATEVKKLSIEEKRLRAIQALDIIERAGYQDIEGKTDLSINHDKYFAESIQST